MHYFQEATSFQPVKLNDTSVLSDRTELSAILEGAVAKKSCLNLSMDLENSRKSPWISISSLS